MVNAKINILSQYLFLFKKITTTNKQMKTEKNSLQIYFPLIV